LYDFFEFETLANFFESLFEFFCIKCTFLLVGIRIVTYSKTHKTPIIIIPTSDIISFSKICDLVLAHPSSSNIISTPQVTVVPSSVRTRFTGFKKILEKYLTK
jgi:hypothetical protein